MCEEAFKHAKIIFLSVAFLYSLSIVNLYQVCLKYSPWAKNGPALGFKYFT